MHTIPGFVFGVSNDGGKTGIYWRKNLDEVMAYFEEFVEGKLSDYAVVAKRDPAHFGNMIVRFKTGRSYHKTDPQIIAMCDIDGGVYFVDAVRGIDGFLPDCAFDRHAVLEAYDNKSKPPKYAPPSYAGYHKTLARMRNKMTEYARRPFEEHALDNVHARNMSAATLKLEYRRGPEILAEAEVTVIAQESWLVTDIKSFDPGHGYARTILEFIYVRSGKPAAPAAITNAARGFWIRMAALALSIPVSHEFDEHDD